MNYLQQIVPGLWLSPLSITAVAVSELAGEPVVLIHASGETHYIKAIAENVDLRAQAEKVVAMVNEARGGE